METLKKCLATLLLVTVLTMPASSFCGFYVAKADASLFNATTQVVVVRNANRSVITMSSDFKGDTRDFAMVVPVPRVLGRDDIRVVERVLFDKLDAYSGPRLVEYWDTNPCSVAYESKNLSLSPAMAKAASTAREEAVTDEATTVRIEAKYTVGEYDILILSAEESGGLERWLVRNGYKIPPGARDVLEPYIKSNMKFFVVKVNLEELDKTGSQLLRPLQVEFESPKFMLPIRLGMANSHGSQDMIVYLLTPNGRVETVNYRTVRIPTDRNIPEFIQDDFGSFYVDVYKHTRRREGKNNIFLEYAWNISGNAGVKCDPCASPPPIFSDLRDAGVNWLRNDQWNGYSGNVFFTRLHVTYDREHFPQDLVFQETPDRSNFQARYIVTHAAPGPFNCPEGRNYVEGLKKRRVKEVQELVRLTGQMNRYSDYLQKLEGMLPEWKEPPAVVPPVKHPDKRRPFALVPEKETSADTVTDTLSAGETVQAAGVSPSAFLDEAGAPDSSGSRSALYLSASILVSTLLFMRMRKK